jgi:hypothetical protein
MISTETFTKQYDFIVIMVANEVNKFGQIFPIHRRRKYKDIG